MKEILTIQLGQLSNYSLVHYWNYQDNIAYDPVNSVDIDVLFRTNVKTCDYNPRTIIVDLKHSLGTLPVNHVHSQESIENHPSTDVHKTTIDKHPYQKYLDANSPTSEPPIIENVRYWSDYNNLFYHPKSILELPHYSHNDSITPFAGYYQGKNMLNESDIKYEFMDERIRYFMEECDSPQGFRIFTDTSNAFSGFSAALLEQLNDGYSKKSIFTVGLSCRELEEKTLHQQHLSQMNQALALKAFSEYSSLYIPIHCPDFSKYGNLPWDDHLQIDSTLYNCSAYLSMVIENLFSRQQQSKSRQTMFEMESLMNITKNTPVVGVTACAPFPVIDEFSIKDIKKKLQVLRPNAHFKHSYDLTLSLPFDEAEDGYSQLATISGVDEILKSAKEIDESDYDILNIFENFASSFRCYKSSSTVIDRPFKVLDTFPNIFRMLNSEGLVENDPHLYVKPKQCALVTRMYSSPRIGKFIDSCAKDLLRMTDSMISKNDLSTEDVKMIYEDLRELSEQYIGD